jgi:hypothetical protein
MITTERDALHGASETARVESPKFADAHSILRCGPLRDTR